MNLLLVTHIMLALLSVMLSGLVTLYATRRQSAPRTVRVMWGATLATLVSGAFLTVQLHTSITASCLSLLSLIIVAGCAHLYQHAVSS